MYVWLDALLGYLTGIGYKNNDELFNKFWNKDTEIIQIVGKEITRFHTIYWPVMLKTLGLRQPSRIISHGWITYGDSKMSKSLGNVVDPHKLINEYGTDAVRYFLAADLTLGTDNKYTDSSFLELYNSKLVNTYGNLVSRVSKMILKFFSGKIINNNVEKLIKNSDMISSMNDAVKIFIENMDNYNLNKANDVVMNMFIKANKYIEDEKPWALFKNDLDKLKIILSELSYIIIIGTYLMKPILVNKYKKVFKQFNVKIKINAHNIDIISIIKTINVSKSSILFERK